MSWTFAQSLAAFRALPPADQSFWHHIALDNTGYTGSDFGSPAYDTRTRTPVQLFHASCIWLEWLELPGLGTQPYWTTAEPPWSIDPSPVDASPFALPIYIQWLCIPQFSDDYPRPKYNVRKTYWTGTPRRRRNL